jgi:hypothetical protein
MSTGWYRLTVIACVVSWFVVGMHLRGLRHVLMQHGGATSWLVLGVTAALAVIGVVGLWVLLRARGPGGGTDPGTPAV